MHLRMSSKQLHDLVLQITGVRNKLVFFLPQCKRTEGTFFTAMNIRTPKNESNSEMIRRYHLWLPRVLPSSYLEVAYKFVIYTIVRKISTCQNKKKKSREQVQSDKGSFIPSGPPVHSTGGSSFAREFYISAANRLGSCSLLKSSKDSGQSKPSSCMVTDELKNHFFVWGVSVSLSSLSTSLDS